ncbi:hypothetical protein A9264_07155 [Vibrio sp. UCD-FRSSP16_10]|uniref:MMPL family transporter n=1 Tax=unclassified Vibrio TaxID=2614977 RepID=UPI0007FBB18B|nr:MULTISPECIES: MMPL family transporter [unclassified Vibrio]OBT13439.1 hypothetical protein A9264_07155 [Vibrio sp. UCD-FRSSP16_10]OBT17949.1 hypothetical protein A9260_01145 [Vibrio sp. UCD-FRSSP16_30]
MQRFTDTIIHFPKFLLLLIVSVTAVAGYYGATQFSINANIENLVKQQGPWHDNLNTVNAMFPETSNVQVVVSSKDIEQAKRATKKLTHAFEQQPLFSHVFAPSTLPWFERNALGFVSDSEFQGMKDNLALLLPSIVASRDKQSLSAYLGALNTQLSSSEFNEQQIQVLIKPLLESLSYQDVNWHSLLLPQATVPNGYVISLNAVPDLRQSEPNKYIMMTVREVISSVGMSADVMVRVTGQTALDFDEIQDANDSIALAGLISLVSLVVILAVGIRSLRIIIASYLAVVVGLIWTLAAGLAVVGAFNTISIVFMVIFIGLGVDFAIHLSLHIYEQRLKGHNNQDSLVQSIQHCISPLSLCALSSAIAFLSFYPTAYIGLGELGVISAIGMVLGLLATFLVIPLFFQFFGYPKVRRDRAKRSKLALKLSEYIQAKHKKIILLTLGGVIVTTYASMQVQFDFSTLILKNKNSESVETMQWLQDHKLGSSYQLLAVAKDEQQAQMWQQQLLKQPEVASVISASSFLPTHLSERALQLQQLFDAQHQQQHSKIKPMTWKAFSEKYAQLLPVSIEANNLDEQALKQHLKTNIESLLSLAAIGNNSVVTVDELPIKIRENYINEQGQWLVSVMPAGDMRDVSTVNAFIEAVQSIAPQATGRALAEQQVGKTVIKAFYIAIGLSVISITIILLLSVSYKRDVLFIFIPLLLTTSTTLAISHWLGQSLNMANIIVIPLIFGLGVDNGIHIVKRFRHEQTITRFFSSSTPKATLISCLTSIATFGSLILAEHQGMHSIGVLLTIALSAILCFSLLILPAFLHRFEPSR